MIAKLPRLVAAPADGLEEVDAATHRVFERDAREVRFYHEIAPRSPDIAPHAYFAAADQENLTVLLLLEDLADWQGGDVLKGCSIDEARLVLDAMAPFHARWWGNSDASHGIPGWLPRWGGDYAARHRRYRGQVGPFLERWGSSLAHEIVDLIEGLARCYGRVLAAIDALPSTVIHADLHLDNVMFARGRKDRPVAILDWQSVCRGPAAADLTQFIVGSLWPEDRRSAGSAVFAHYAELLASNGVRRYSSDRLLDDCRLVLLWLLAGTVGWLARADSEKMSGRERELVLSAFGDGRLTSALIDFDAEGRLRDFQES